MKFFRQKIKLSVIIVLAITNALVWFVLISERRGDVLTVAFLDVGQGDAIFIEAPNGNQIIFDGGPNGKILSELGKLMPFYDRTIDMIVVTNPDKDHFAGFLDVLDRFKVLKVMEPGTKPNTNLYLDFLKAVENESAEKIIARRGMRIELDRERAIYIDILFPDRDASELKTNDGSIVARLSYASTSVMLTGDAPKKVEDYVVELEERDGSEGAAGSSLKSDILKIGHHGSKTSTGENFLAEIVPKYAVISSGKNNKYGHPNVETLDTLKKSNITVFRTDKQGTIIMKSDGRVFDVGG